MFPDLDSDMQLKNKVATYCMIHLCEMPRMGKSIEMENRSVVARTWEEAGLGIQIVP